MTRVLGIVGGTGPESTIDYYRRLVAGWRRRRPDGSYPRVLIDSIEAGTVIRAIGEGDLDRAASDLADAVAELEAAGAGRALLASNAVHLAFDRVAGRSRIPLIHIVDAARAAAESRGYRRLALLGARFVMESPMYPERFGAAFEIVTPNETERAWVHDVYMNELIPGIVRDETRDGLVRVIAAMRDRYGLDAAILGGTELATILTQDVYAGVPMLDTAGVHVDAALDWLLGEDPA